MERHHPYGRFGPGDSYISDWTIPVTKDLHDRIHVALRAAGLDFPRKGTVHENHQIYFLQRLCLQLEILADQ